MFGGIVVVKVIKNRESEDTEVTKTFAGKKRLFFILE